MDDNDQQPQEILLSVYEAQRQESLQHRQTIFNTFSLSMVGLMAILAGVIAPGHMPSTLKWPVAIAIVIISISTIRFIRQQRQESEKAMRIMRSVENHLGFYEPGRYWPDQSLLPKEYSKSHTTWTGLSRADLFSAASILLLGIVIIILLVCMPVSP
jgi:hypothetical protein